MSFVIPSLPKRGQKYGRGQGTPTLSMKLCWCVESLGMYTQLLVCTGVWLVKSMSWICMLMGEGGHIVVSAGSVHSSWGGGGGENVIWCVGSNIKL